MIDADKGGVHDKKGSKKFWISSTLEVNYASIHLFLSSSSSSSSSSSFYFFAIDGSLHLLIFYN